MMTYLFFPFFQ